MTNLEGEEEERLKVKWGAEEQNWRVKCLKNAKRVLGVFAPVPGVDHVHTSLTWRNHSKLSYFALIFSSRRRWHAHRRIPRQIESKRSHARDHPSSARNLGFPPTPRLLFTVVLLFKSHRERNCFFLFLLCDLQPSSELPSHLLIIGFISLI